MPIIKVLYSHVDVCSFIINVNMDFINILSIIYCYRTLLAHMIIFSKMRNPRSIYREPDLNKAYLDLLTHKIPEVQKMALDCLVTYKHKFLIPYR
jgi:hypothetical protein